MNTGGHGGVALAKLRGVARITLGGIAGASVSPHVLVIAVSGAVCFMLMQIAMIQTVLNALDFSRDSWAS